MFFPIFNLTLIAHHKTMMCNLESPAIAIKHCVKTCSVLSNERFVASYSYYTVTTESSQIISPSCCTHRVYQKTSETESDPRDTVDWGKSWLVDFNVGKTQLGLFDRSNNNGSIDGKMDGFVLEEKSCSKMLGLTFSSNLDWGSYIISIAKSDWKKTGALFRCMKFFSPEVPLYLCKYTVRPCIGFSVLHGVNDYAEFKLFFQK